MFEVPDCVGNGLKRVIKGGGNLLLLKTIIFNAAACKTYLCTPFP